MSRPNTALLERARPFLRLPGSPDAPPEIVPGETAFRDPSTGRVYPIRDGVLDVLDPDFRPTDAQKLLDRGWSAGLYDWARPHLPRLLGMPPFAEEVANIEERLSLEPGDAVLDVACGQGNFTAELARAVGASGLVIGLDIARSMLARAADRMRREEIDNVLLIRADALRLPLADTSFRRVNCSGGIHQFPDLTRAIREMGRVQRPGGRLTVSGFAESAHDPMHRFKRWTARYEAHFVPMDRLAAELEAAGYADVGGSMTGRWVGYRWGEKRAA